MINRHNQRMFRHLVAIQENIDRASIHLEYAEKHLENIVNELDNPERYKEYLGIIRENREVFERLNDVDWEKEKKRYKDKLFEDE